MRLPRSLALTLAAAALIQTQTSLALSAQAQQTCVSEAEIVAMAGFVLPSLLEGTMTSCKPHLATTGYFATDGKALVDKYAARKDAAWPGAKAAMLKLGASKDDEMTKAFKSMPDAALQPFVAGMVTQLVGDKLKPGQCVAIERGAMLLAPLPADNTAQLIGFILALVGQNEKPGGKNPINVCKVGA